MHERLRELMLKEDAMLKIIALDEPENHILEYIGIIENDIEEFLVDTAHNIDELLRLLDQKAETFLCHFYE